MPIFSTLSKRKLYDPASAIFDPFKIGTPQLWLSTRYPHTMISDGAASFASASSQYLYSASNSSLNLGTSWFISFWWYKTATASAWIISKDDKSATREFAIYTNGANIALMQVIAGAARAFFGPSISTNNAWYFVSAGYNGTTLSISINNGTPTTADWTGAATNSNAEFRIGASAANSDYVSGIIDSICYCKNPSVSFATLATATYNSGSGLTYNSLTQAQKTAWGLVSWWDLNESTGTRADRHGSNDLTASASSPTVANGIVSGRATYTGDVISQWSDLSGNARHVTQSTASAKPTLALAALNGQPAIVFDGTDDALATASNIGISGTQARTLITVGREYNSGADFPSFAGWGGTTNYTAFMHLVYNGTVGLDIWGEANSTTISNGTYTILSSHLDDNNKAVSYRNGTLLGTTTNSVNTTNTTLKVGYTPHSTIRYLNSRIVEVLLYNRNLLSSERQYIERGLGAAYGITVV